jgi:hypothetical protein
MGFSGTGVFIPIWAFLFIRFWERKQNALAYYWFTTDLSSNEKVSPRRNL